MEFRCARCGGVFQTVRSDDEAEAEALRIFGVERSSQRADMAVICDDCWREGQAAGFIPSDDND